MTARMSPSIKLTNPNPMLTQLENQTHPGMAHWGGTGPDGKSCRECGAFEHHDRRDAHGTLKPARCRKYSELTNGKIGKAVPFDARACKYFLQADDVPRISG